MSKAWAAMAAFGQWILDYARSSIGTLRRLLKVTLGYCSRLKIQLLAVSTSIKSWFRTPWSIRHIARHDEATWRQFNRRRKELRLTRFESDLLFAGEHPVRFSISLLVLAVLAHLFFATFPIVLLEPSWTVWKDAEDLVHFSTLWTVQATIAALVYPIVIAFVTVYLQRRPAADAFVHLYVLDSGAIAAGLSSLTLVVFMAAQYVALPYLGTDELRGWAAFDAIWFLLNAYLTAQFLYQTIDFLRPEVQLRVIKRYSVNVALPREIYRLNLFQIIAQAQAKHWLPGTSYADTTAVDGPRVIFTPLSIGGEPQGYFHFSEPSRLINVHLWPLRLAVGHWLRQAEQWGQSANVRPRRPRQWPLLTVAVTPGAEYRESRPLALVDNGPPLASWQRALIRWSCVFQPVRRERYGIRVKTILKELESDAREAAETARVEAFERAYETLVGLHYLLIGASLAKADDGSTGSWAVLPDILASFERPVYGGWVETYRSIFLAAISAMESNTRPVQRLCNLVGHLNGPDLTASPVEVRENVLQLPPLMMYQLAEWWTRRIEAQGKIEHGPNHAVELDAPESRVYEQVLESFVGGWENGRTFLCDIPEVREGFVWSSAQSIGRLNWFHLNETARMLLAAVIRGDKVVAEWFADVLSKWWGNGDSSQHSFTVFEKTQFLTLAHVQLDWTVVATEFNIDDDDLRWSGGRIEQVQRAVLVAALKNLWTDIRILVLELLLMFARENGSETVNSLAMDILAGLLNGQQWRSGGTLSESLRELTAPRYLAAKVRQYASDGGTQRGYETLLSRLISGVRDAVRPSMIGSRAYSFMGADDIASLQEQQLLLFFVLSTRPWTVGEILRRQIAIWMTRQYPSIEIIRHTNDSLLQRLTLEQESPPRLFGELCQRTSRSHEIAEGRENTRQGLESLRSAVEALRTEVLVSQPVDPARLSQVARFASLKAFSPSSGKFPIQLFATVSYSTVRLQDFTLVRQQVPKGELTVVTMDQRAGNEEQFWSETMALHVGALLMSDVLGSVETREVIVPDPITFWTVLKAEAARLTVNHEHAILILDNATRPDWVWQWAHSDRADEYPRPDDLVVRRVSERGDGYVCNFNDVEIYVGPIQPGCSIFLARESFFSATFTEFEAGRYVDVDCETSADSNVTVDLKLRISRKVELGNSPAVRFRYASDHADSGKTSS